MPAFRLGEKRILFIHIPKAGGTSVKNWLSEHSAESLYQKHRPILFPCVPQHFHGDILNTLFASGFFDYSFCISRNPYDRIVSEYNYRITRPRLKNKIFPKPSFDRWLTSAINKYAKDPFVHSNHIRPQHEFLIDGTEAFALEVGLKPLRDRISDLTGVELSADAPRENPSQKTITTMTEKAADRVFEFYAEDFNRFGYDRDSWRER
jgi:hypothetical protein